MCRLVTVVLLVVDTASIWYVCLATLTWCCRDGISQPDGQGCHSNTLGLKCRDSLAAAAVSMVIWRVEMNVGHVEVGHDRHVEWVMFIYCIYVCGAAPLSHTKQQRHAYAG